MRARVDMPRGARLVAGDMPSGTQLVAGDMPSRCGDHWTYGHFVQPLAGAQGMSRARRACGCGPGRAGSGRMA
jgi:hypothetical protein